MPIKVTDCSKTRLHQQQNAANEDPEDPYTKMSPHINGLRFTSGFIFK